MPEQIQLPLRLVPRRWAQIVYSAFFGFFFAFSVFWIGASMRPDVSVTFNGEPVTDPLHRKLFPLFGVPFLLVGLGGLAYNIAKLLPGSPYSYIEVSAAGLRVRTFWRRRDLAWRDLPEFEILRTRGSGDDVSLYHYAVAKQAEGSGRPGELVRISAGEYGFRNNEASAAALAGWLNQIRSLALQNALRPGELVEIPDALIDRAATMAATPTAPPARTPTVVKRR